MPIPKRFKLAYLIFPVFFSVNSTASASEWPPGGIGGTCCPWSDKELKTNIHPLENATQELLKIQGVDFEWKDSGRKDIGIIAQDVKKVYPQLVREDKQYMQVDYNKLIAPLIESVRELDARIKVLESHGSK